jgi:2-succinyl-5-enolpyruvyl-6-hydroxy-3-cyclohexene-1-carboxylate synthase
MDQLVVFGDDDAGWASVSASSVAPGDRVQTFYSDTTVVGTVTAVTKNDEGGVDLDVAFDTPVYGDTGATIWFDDGDEVDKLTSARLSAADRER